MTTPGCQPPFSGWATRRQNRKKDTHSTKWYLRLHWKLLWRVQLDTDCAAAVELVAAECHAATRKRKQRVVLALRTEHKPQRSVRAASTSVDRHVAEEGVQPAEISDASVRKSCTGAPCRH